MGIFNKHTPSVLEYYGTQIQSAVQALPIAIMYGAPRVPCNVIYVNGFNAVKQNQGKGGKGLLTGGKGQPVQYLYYATLITALGEGPIQNIIVIYQDSNVWFNLSNIREVDPNSQVGKSGLPNLVPTNAQFFPGGPNQEPWSYIESHWPSDARGYKDTCYIGLPNMQLDSTATPPQLNYVPRAIFSGTCPLNPTTFTGAYTDNSGQHQDSFNAGYIDADPASCIYDFLANDHYGAGFPANLIDPGIFSNQPQCFDAAIGDSSLQTYCQAVGFGWCIVLNNIESAGSILDRVCKNMAVAVVWTGETLKFIPYYDSYSGANPGWGADNPLGIGQKFFNPNIAPLMNFTDDHMLQSQNPEEEPVTADRIDPVDAYNYVRVSFRDRTNQFNENVAEASDEANIELFGPRVDTASAGEEFSLLAYAQASATMQLRRNLSVRRRLTFRLPPEFAFLDPMDIVTVTSGIFSNFAVRIVSLEEDEQGVVTVVAEEFPVGSASPTVFPGAPTTPPAIFQTNAPPPSVNTPAIFEPTVALLNAENQPAAQVVIGASGQNADPNWGGADIYISLDNSSYTWLGRITSPARQGVLTAGLASYSSPNPDNTNTLSVSLAESGGELQSTTTQNASAGATLSIVIDASGAIEILSFATAALVGANSYNLTGLYRGLYGTAANAHLSGAQFLRIDNNVFQTALPPQFIGQTIYFKLTSFNIYNTTEQEISDSDVLVYTYVPNGSGFSNLLLLAGTATAGASGQGPLSHTP